MRVYERLNHLQVYDDIDLRDSYRQGFWIGAVSGLVGMFILCFMAGVYVYT